MQQMSTRDQQLLRIILAVISTIACAGFIAVMYSAAEIINTARITAQQGEKRCHEYTNAEETN